MILRSNLTVTAFLYRRKRDFTQCNFTAVPAQMHSASNSGTSKAFERKLFCNRRKIFTWMKAKNILCKSCFLQGKDGLFVIFAHRLSVVEITLSDILKCTQRKHFLNVAALLCVDYKDVINKSRRLFDKHFCKIFFSCKSFQHSTICRTFLPSTIF